jgi:hypothetical protein
VKVVKSLKKTKFKYNVIPKEEINTVLQDYNISAYPTHIIIDKNSNVKFYAEGLDTSTLATLTATIETLLKK